MADYKEVRHERLYLKEPGTERIRKNSAARLRHLLATGWRETERWYADRAITVKVERTGVDDIRDLVGALVQTDRFGTSISQALRVHSEGLRTERRQRAEELDLSLSEPSRPPAVEHLSEGTARAMGYEENDQGYAKTPASRLPTPGLSIAGSQQLLGALIGYMFERNGLQELQLRDSARR